MVGFEQAAIPVVERKKDKVTHAVSRSSNMQAAATFFLNLLLLAAIQCYLLRTKLREVTLHTEVGIPRSSTFTFTIQICFSSFKPIPYQM